MATASIGRIVHYVATIRVDDNDVIEHRPAIVLKVYENEVVDLYVFSADGLNVISSSISQDEETKESGTWHWPEVV